MATQDPWHKFAEVTVLQTPNGCGNPRLIFTYASHVHAHKPLESMDLGTLHGSEQCGLWTRRMNITCKLIKKTNSWAPLQT